jgi:signal transduction histidine kinase
VFGNSTTPQQLINNRFELVETIAEGGMGNTYRAFDHLRQRSVWLKILDGDHPIAPPRLHRFKSEFRRTPGIVELGGWEVYDLGLTEQGYLFMTLELHEQPREAPDSPSALGGPDEGWARALSLGDLLEGERLQAMLAWTRAYAGAERVCFQPVGEEGREGALVVMSGDSTDVTDFARLTLERARYEREPSEQRADGRIGLALPLVAEERVCACLWLEGPEAALRPELALSIWPHWIAAAASDVRIRRIEENKHHLERLNDLARAVSSTLDLNAILSKVLRHALDVSEAEQGAVFWGTERLATMDRSGAPVPELQVSQSVIQQVLDKHKPIALIDTQEDERFATKHSIMNLRLRSIMCVPLLAGERPYGVLYVSSQSVARTFGPTDLSVLEGLAGQVSLALANARAHRTIQDLNAGLEENVRVRTAELESTLQELRKTQGQLVQAEKMSSLGQMVAGVAHELNNPLNFIHGNTKVFRNYAQDLFGLIGLYGRKLPSDPEIAERKQDIDFDYLLDDITKTIDSVLKGTVRCQKIVADLKTFSGHDEAELKPTDLKEGVESTISVVQGRFGDRVTFELDVQPVPQINAFGKQLNQAFLALLTNACQALSAPGTVSVRLATEGDEVVLRVSDTGVGIPPEHLSKIFDPFFTTRPIGEGTGLGLTTAYSVVDRHRGRIEVSSHVGAGSTFTIRLPLSGVSGDGTTG